MPEKAQITDSLTVFTYLINKAKQPPSPFAAPLSFNSR
jgi:hypothetical protein